MHEEENSGKKPDERYRVPIDNRDAERPPDMDIVQKVSHIIYVAAITGGLVLGGLVVWFLSWLHSN